MTNIAAANRTEKKSKVLRDLLKAPGCLITIWGGCAHHAQLAENAGFKVFGVSGSKVSSWIYGMPDAGLFSPKTELVDTVRNICNAVKIPVFS